MPRLATSGSPENGPTSLPLAAGVVTVVGGNVQPSSGAALKPIDGSNGVSLVLGASMASTEVMLELFRGGEGCGFIPGLRRVRRTQPVTRNT